MTSKPKLARSSNYAKGEHVIDQDALDILAQNSSTEMELANLIKDVLESGDFEPPMLPEIAISLTQLASRPDVDFTQVEKVVSKDPVVAAKIVAVANSAFYSRGQPVRSLTMAIARLGLAAVRDVAFQVVAQTTIFKASGYADRMRTLYGAAQISGLLAREVCVKLKFESDMAYLCGLLHDMGEAIILGIVATACKKNNRELYPLSELEKTIDHLHPQVGAKIGESWGLPELLCDSIKFHHKSEQSVDPLKMATVIAVSDVLLKHVGMGVTKQRVDPMGETSFYRLNLTPQQVQELLDYAEELVKDQI